MDVRATVGGYLLLVKALSPCFDLPVVCFLLARAVVRVAAVLGKSPVVWIRRVRIMRRRFWNFVHDALERAWHWVYYHKLHDPKYLDSICPKNITYTFLYGRSACPAINFGPSLIDLGPNYLMNKTLDGSPAARYQCSVCGGRNEPCEHWGHTENEQEG